MNRVPLQPADWGGLAPSGPPASATYEHRPPMFCDYTRGPNLAGLQAACLALSHLSIAPIE